VCKRIDRRVHALNLSGVAAYRTYLTEHPTEWAALETLCPIPISRFFRDARVFDRLGEFVLPEIADRAARREPAAIRCWSAGCASGEEPYSVSLLWAHRVGPRYPQIALALVATDVDEHLIERARAACYAKQSARASSGVDRSRVRSPN
jgi:chemotaxis protein methyltransferase CheR